MNWLRMNNALEKWIRQCLDKGMSKEVIKRQLVQKIDRELYWDEEEKEE